jgi:TPR repeat protein
MNSVGHMYENGKGITGNTHTAIEWYIKAANQGNKYAQFYLGLLYQNYHQFKDLQRLLIGVKRLLITVWRMQKLE